jgi:hypothetical protein
LSLQEQSDKVLNQKKTRAYEKMTMTLETLVSSINTISLNMSKLEAKLENNERRAQDIMNIVNMKEKLSNNDPHFETRGYLE